MVLLSPYVLASAVVRRRGSRDQMVGGCHAQSGRCLRRGLEGEELISNQIDETDVGCYQQRKGTSH